MSEELSTPELPKVTKDQALAAFKQFVEQGYTSPDDLPLDDPAVIEANRVLDAWSSRAKRGAEESPDPAAAFDYELVRSTFYIDAGFTDADYIDEVANEWLAQDLDRAREAGLDEVADRIQAKIDELNAEEVDLEAQDFAGRPDVVRDKPLIVSCNLYEASTLHAMFKKQLDDDPDLQQALQEIEASFEEVGIRQSRGGLTWNIPSNRSADVVIFRLPPGAALRAQQLMRPAYMDKNKKATQAVYRNIYDQVSRPQIT